VCPLLTDRQHLIDFVRLRTVAGDRLIFLSCEPDLAIRERDAVRAAERAKIDASEFRPREQIHHR